MGRARNGIRLLFRAQRKISGYLSDLWVVCLFLSLPPPPLQPVKYVPMSGSISGGGRCNSAVGRDAWRKLDEGKVGFDGFEVVLLFLSLSLSLSFLFLKARGLIVLYLESSFFSGIVKV